MSVGVAPVPASARVFFAPGFDQVGDVAIARLDFVGHAPFGRRAHGIANRPAVQAALRLLQQQIVLRHLNPSFAYGVFGDRFMRRPKYIPCSPRIRNIKGEKNLAPTEFARIGIVTSTMTSPCLDGGTEGGLPHIYRAEYTIAKLFTKQRQLSPRSSLT